MSVCYRLFKGVHFKKNGDSYHFIVDGSDKVITLDETGYDFLQAFDKKTTVDSALAALMKTYAVDEDILRTDLKEFISEAVKNKLLKKT